MIYSFLLPTVENDELNHSLI